MNRRIAIVAAVIVAAGVAGYAGYRTFASPSVAELSEQLRHKAAELPAVEQALPAVDDEIKGGALAEASEKMAQMADIFAAGLMAKLVPAVAWVAICERDTDLKGEACMEVEGDLADQRTAIVAAVETYMTACVKSLPATLIENVKPCATDVVLHYRIATERAVVEAAKAFEEMTAEGDES